MNFYEILKTKKLGRGSPDYWTQLFAEHVGVKGERKVTGVLPLTFTAKGGTAVDWVIYGNDDNGTVNFFNKETLTNGYVVEAHGTQANVYRSYSDYIPIESSTTYYMEHVVGASSFYSGVEYDVNKQVIGNFGVLGNYNASGIYTSSANAKYIRVNIATTFKDIVTVVKGSTAPDHYIPYQQGVGERTKNLWDADNWNGATVQRGTMERIGNSFKITATSNDAYTKTYASSTYAYEVTPNEQYTLSWKVSDTSIFGQIFVFTGENEGNMVLISINASAQSVTFTIPNNHHYLSFRLGVAYSGNILTYSDVMLTKGSTAPSTYIPYGYQIPLIVSQAGQPDKTYDIYIGDSPLTEGETVSKTSTGVDIELFKGENTVSTTLYNKPTMEIKYK